MEYMEVKMVSEQDIQRQITDYLKLKRIFHRKVNTVGIKKSDGSYIPSQSAGMSDIIGCLWGGRFLAIEVKKKGGKVSPLQQAFLDEVNDNGGLGFVAYSLDEVIKKLDN